LKMQFGVRTKVVKKAIEAIGKEKGETDKKTKSGTASS